MRDREMTSVRARDEDAGRGCSRTTVDREASSVEWAAIVPVRMTDKSAGDKDNLSQRGGRTTSLRETERGRSRTSNGSWVRELKGGLISAVHSI